MIQIAGVLDREDLKTILDAGVEFVGFPLKLAYHAQDISEEVAADLIKAMPATSKPVLITYLNQAEEILKLSRFIRSSVIQLHGEIDLSQLQKLRRLEPDISIIKSLIVRKDNIDQLLHEMNLFSPYVEFFITDTFDPATGATGATGKTHDWNISKKLAELSPRPLILAGGLNDRNVVEAIEFVRPAGVDAHTGVEDSAGRKDRKLLQDFVERARAALRL